MNLKQLDEPFSENDVEWRIGQAGMKNGKPWAKVLCYITNRAVMNRLDEVCGKENWQDEYLDIRNGAGDIIGLKCGVSIKIGENWVTKWDGAECSDIEPIKGAFSDAEKRASVKWGIGRYLYDLKETWANIHPDGSHYSRVKVKIDGQDKWIDFNWDAPRLPAWALPGTNQKSEEFPKQETAPKQETVQESEQHKAFSFAVNALINSTGIPVDRVDDLFLRTLEELPDENGEILDLHTVRGCKDQGVFDALLNVLKKETEKKKAPPAIQSEQYKQFRKLIEGIVDQAERAGLDIWPEGIPSVMQWLVSQKVFESSKDLVECKDIRKFAAAQKRVENYQEPLMPREVTV